VESDRPAKMSVEVRRKEGKKPGGKRKEKTWTTLLGHRPTNDGIGGSAQTEKKRATKDGRFESSGGGGGHREKGKLMTGTLGVSLTAKPAVSWKKNWVWYTVQGRKKPSTGGQIEKKGDGFWLGKKNGSFKTVNAEIL